MVEAVTFDFWNTVMWEEPGSLKERRLEVWIDAVSEAGIAIDPVALEAAHDRAHKAYIAAWVAGRQFRVADAAALMIEDLGPQVPEEMESVLVEGFSEAGRRAAVHPSDGVEECLSALADARVRLGIVCDIGLTPASVVRSLLDREGLLELFDDTAFSDEVGHYKPAPEIFEHALAGLGGVRPHASAHVGDRRRTDVAGALALGMTAVRYNGVYEDDWLDGPEADIVVHQLAGLPELLGEIDR